MIIVGNKCPEFLSTMLLNNEIKPITEKDLQGHYSLFFFYSFDFSAVCPTELRALQANISEFVSRKVDVIAVSCDSIYIHTAFAATPIAQGGIEGVSFKMISDEPQELTRAFGVYDEVHGVPLRGTFIIDENLTIQYGQVNNLMVGRSVKEILRVIDAIQFAATNDSLCPMGWKKGDKAIQKSVRGYRLE